MLFLLFLPFARIYGRRRELIFFSFPIAFFLIAAFTSHINMGVRYLLSIYPFCIVLASAAAAALFTRSAVGKVAVAALLLLTVFSSLHSYPNFLAYSNEFFGGPTHTYRFATDSNADWGQGLKWTKTYLEQHPDDNCWFDYYGDPKVGTASTAFTASRCWAAFAHLVGMGGTPVPATISGTVLVSSTRNQWPLMGSRQPQPLPSLPRSRPRCDHRQHHLRLSRNLQRPTSRRRVERRRGHRPSTSGPPPGSTGSGTNRRPAGPRPSRRQLRPRTNPARIRPYPGGPASHGHSAPPRPRGSSRLSSGHDQSSLSTLQGHP